MHLTCTTIDYYPFGVDRTASGEASFLPGLLPALTGTTSSVPAFTYLTLFNLFRCRMASMGLPYLFAMIERVSPFLTLWTRKLSRSWGGISAKFARKTSVFSAGSFILYSSRFGG